jgi:folate-binding protein YgfZ
MTASPPEEYRAARDRAAFFETSAGLLVVSGRDRGSYLQGLLTNDTAGLSAGHGCYAAYLTPQGRMIADMWVHELGDVILLRLPLAVKDTVLTRLDQFIFSEDVRLRDVTDAFRSVAVVGPRAAAAVADALAIDAALVAGEDEGHNARVTFAGESAFVLRPTSIGVGGLELLVSADAIDALHAALRAAGAAQIGSATAETLRIEAGVPLFGVDMNEETIPLEAGIESRAISFTKGCYVGQEVIVRVLHRGHGRIARRLVGIVFDGASPIAAGTALRAGDKEVGTVTSGVVSPALDHPVALAYVKRDFAEPGTRVLTPDDVAGQVVAVPFNR